MPKSPPRLKITQAPQPKRERWGTTKGKRLTGRTNQKAREELFRDEPLCRECRRQGRIRIATIRDHIKALAFGGEEHRDNTQPLCKECHDAKSKAEAAEGLRRARG